MASPDDEPARYEVIVSDVADWEARQEHERLTEVVSPEYADRWLEGLVRRIEDLTLFPRRHPVARENDLYHAEIRRLLYFGPNRQPARTGSVYRVLFHIVEARSEEAAGLARVLSVRHGARQPDKP